MKRILFTFVLTISGTAFAWDNKDIETPYNRDNGKYESSFGNRYEYDLSRPSDRIKYDTDPSAKIRDSVDVDPMRDIERDLGQYGGGKVNRRRH